MDWLTQWWHYVRSVLSALMAHLLAAAHRPQLPPPPARTTHLLDAAPSTVPPPAASPAPAPADKRWHELDPIGDTLRRLRSADYRQWLHHVRHTDYHQLLDRVGTAASDFYDEPRVSPGVAAALAVAVVAAVVLRKRGRPPRKTGPRVVINGKAVAISAPQHNTFRHVAGTNNAAEGAVPVQVYTSTASTGTGTGTGLNPGAATNPGPNPQASTYPPLADPLADLEFEPHTDDEDTLPPASEFSSAGASTLPSEIDGFAQGDAPWTSGTSCARLFAPKEGVARIDGSDEVVALSQTITNDTDEWAEEVPEVAVARPVVVAAVVGETSRGDPGAATPGAALRPVDTEETEVEAAASDDDDYVEDATLDAVVLREVAYDPVPGAGDEDVDVASDTEIAPLAREPSLSASPPRPSSSASASSGDSAGRDPTSPMSQLLRMEASVNGHHESAPELYEAQLYAKGQDLYSDLFRRNGSAASLNGSFAFGDDGARGASEGGDSVPSDPIDSSPIKSSPEEPSGAFPPSSPRAPSVSPPASSVSPSASSVSPPGSPSAVPPDATLLSPPRASLRASPSRPTPPTLTLIPTVDNSPSPSLSSPRSEGRLDAKPDGLSPFLTTSRSPPQSPFAASLLKSSVTSAVTAPAPGTSAQSTTGTTPPVLDPSHPLAGFPDLYHHARPVATDVIAQYQCLISFPERSHYEIMYRQLEPLLDYMEHPNFASEPARAAYINLVVELLMRHDRGEAKEHAATGAPGHAPGHTGHTGHTGAHPGHQHQAHAHPDAPVHVHSHPGSQPGSHSGQSGNQPGSQRDSQGNESDNNRGSDSESTPPADSVHQRHLKRALALFFDEGVAPPQGTSRATLTPSASSATLKTLVASFPPATTFQQVFIPHLRRVFLFSVGASGSAKQQMALSVLKEYLRVHEAAVVAEIAEQPLADTTAATVLATLTDVIAVVKRQSPSTSAIPRKYTAGSPSKVSSPQKSLNMAAQNQWSPVAASLAELYLSLSRMLLKSDKVPEEKKEELVHGCLGYLHTHMVTLTTIDPVTFLPSAVDDDVE
ncbi:hypothetical protein DICA3_F09274 [Diutina catenulata]